MASSVQEVLDLIEMLRVKSYPAAEREMEDLRHFAKSQGNTEELQLWDVPFWSERFREHSFNYKEEELREFFALPNVLSGLFQLANRLFNIVIEEPADLEAQGVQLWNKDVRFFNIRDASSGEYLASFYLDPYSRPSEKRGGAWMDDVRSRWLRPDNGHIQTPIAHLVCNFAEGVDGNPPLLTHDDVITLFHEFGHGLHHMLTQVNERDVSGISGVEWDAVELPSQLMENFCWEWSVLKNMTSHVNNGEALPRELFDKMVAAKNYQSGLQTLRQIEFALFDMLLHTEHQVAEDFMPLLRQVRAEISVIQVPEFNRMAHTFSHIFAGGYAAGYYSYKWAEVLSADAYAAFEETALADGTPNLETGRRYRQAILEAGGSRPALASFVEFRGRAPSLDALLRHQGMTANQVAR
jgi:oligopeptidase A